MAATVKQFKKHLIQSKKDIAPLVEALKKVPYFVWDTEFLRENTFFPIVELLQIATEDQAWIIDLQAFRDDQKKLLDPLWEIFKNPKILKIVHAAQGDQECLWTSYQTLAKPLLDTAIAASLCGFKENIGLSNLADQLLNVDLKKGHTRSNWAIRPLPEALQEYAFQDVEILIHVAQKLLENLDSLNRREWAIELSSEWTEPSRFEVNPLDQATKLASHTKLSAKSWGVLIELVIWREERVRKLNLPRKWLADDQVLIDLSKVRPKTIEHLSTFRGINKGEIRNQGSILLNLIEKGSAEPRFPQPEVKKTKQPSFNEVMIQEYLKLCLTYKAEESKLSIKNRLGEFPLLELIRISKKEEVKEEHFAAYQDVFNYELSTFKEFLMDLLNSKKTIGIDKGQFSVR